MRIRLVKSIGASAVIASVFIVVNHAPVASETVPATNHVLKASWGEPDLQGIWTVESDTPLQRSSSYANQEFFTKAQREVLDKERSALLGREKRVERGTELDVAGAYNAVFMSMKHIGARTSMIVDPPNGRIPPLMPAAEKIAAADQESHLALKDSAADFVGVEQDPLQ